MSIIKRLPEKVVNQIAAGEVVERPASVLKEIMENALDAGATKVDVIIEDGGIKRIEVRDNGKGIAKEDLAAALERYSTSKLADISDLEQIGTYGFRGEALASISSVAKVTLTSKPKDAEVAYKITSEYGDLSIVTPASRDVGTTIEVENIFQTVPARLKFLKSKDTEYKYVLETFQNIALINAHIAFTLTHNNKRVYDLPASQQKVSVERILDILKVEKGDIISISHNEYGITIEGFMLHPKKLGETARFMRLFVNTRPVDDKGIARSLIKGISGYVPDTFKPSAILNISVDSSQVDVNVHPRKTEVKFLNPFRIYSAVSTSVQQTLKNAVADELGIPQGVLPKSSSFSRNFGSNWDRRSDNAVDRLRGSSANSFPGMTGMNSMRSYENTETNYQETLTDTSPVYEYSQTVIESSATEENPAERELKRTLAQQTLVKAYAILGRYIIAEWEQEMWVIDQHAAAERIRYEQLKKAILEGKKLITQKLLIPVEIPLSEDEKVAIGKHHDLLEQLGFETDIKEDKVALHAIPHFLARSDIERLFRDVMGEILDFDSMDMTPDVSDFSSSRGISLVIATIACHNSIRMNERLEDLQAKSIVEDLLKCDIPYACPHGRRIIWILKSEEIDRMFMR
jgi:DNA mismatch repair protein MutL